MKMSENPRQDICPFEAVYYHLYHESDRNEIAYKKKAYNNSTTCKTLDTLSLVDRQFTAAGRNFWAIFPKLYEKIYMKFIVAVSNPIVNKDKSVCFPVIAVHRDKIVLTDGQLLRLPDCPDLRQRDDKAAGRHGFPARLLDDARQDERVIHCVFYR